MIRSYFVFILLLVFLSLAETLRLNDNDVNNVSREFLTPQIIYVNAFARSMSSTMQAFLKTLGSSKSTFSLFEPCHPQDVSSYGSLWEEDTAAKCVSDVLKCDFSKIQTFHHTQNQISKYDNKCSTSSTNNIKTISVHNLTNVINMLDSHLQGMNVVHILRDPRSILASQKKAFINKRFHHMQTVAEVCRIQLHNLGVFHPRIRKVHFHDIVSAPEIEFKKLTQDLGYTFTASQANFVTANFNNPKCDDAAYSTCRTNSRICVRKWEQDLNDEEKNLFTNNKECMKVIRAYYGDDHSLFLKKRFPYVSIE